MFCRWCLEITYAVVNNLDALYLFAVNTLALIHINFFYKLTENFSRELKDVRGQECDARGHLQEERQAYRL